MLLPSGLSTTDYSRLANSKGWSSGWPNCQAVNTFGLGQVAGPRSGATIQGGVNKRIQTLCQQLISATEKGGYMLVKGWCWGYGCRAIAGSSTPSNHSWGLAMDVNAPTNPYTSGGQHDIPDWVFAMFRRYGFGVGADYSGRKDWMHFEFMGTPGDADIMTALAVKEFGTDSGKPGGGTEEDDLPYSEQQVKQMVHDGVEWALEDIASVDPLIIKKALDEKLPGVVREVVAQLTPVVNTAVAKLLPSAIIAAAGELQASKEIVHAGVKWAAEDPNVGWPSKS